MSLSQILTHSSLSKSSFLATLLQTAAGVGRMVETAARAVPSSVYRHFRGIWNAIDMEDLPSLATDPQLPTLLNQRQQGLTPLYLAVLRHNAPMVHFLLAAGADPNLLSLG